MVRGLRPLRTGNASCVGVEQPRQRRVHRLGFVMGREFAQAALAFGVLARKFGDRLLGASVRLVEKGRAQRTAAGFEAGLGVTRGGERLVDQALPLAAGFVDARLGAGFGVEKTLQRRVHRPNP